jgi:hypothetical protein
MRGVFRRNGADTYDHGRGWTSDVREMAEESHVDHANLKSVAPPLIMLAVMVGGVILNLVWSFPTWWGRCWKRL